MTSIIDLAVDPTPRLDQLKAAGVNSIFSYLSSINPMGEKCWTVKRVREVSAAGFRIGLVHEGWGGVGGRGISEADGARDGKFCIDAAEKLGAPTGVDAACIYFACDSDFNMVQIKSLVTPYFQAIEEANADGRYRIGVYGSGLVCSTMFKAQLVDYTWLAQSRGWMGYSSWLPQATMVQGAETRIAGLDVDPNIGRGDIGDYMPVWPDLVA